MDFAVAVELHNESSPYPDAVSRLRATRQEILELGQAIKAELADPPGQPADHAPHTGFPRSRIVRALVGTGSRERWLGGAALAFVLARPRLALRVAQWLLTQPVARRVIWPLIFRKLRG